uniref:Uncharacterized protein n=1 Tax=Rhizophora mucronata TaxID=61149 RepID=A0A2P2NL41_RHIMU
MPTKIVIYMSHSSGATRDNPIVGKSSWQMSIMIYNISASFVRADTPEKGSIAQIVDYVIQAMCIIYFKLKPARNSLRMLN